jgi:predicted CopG family antitoxin
MAREKRITVRLTDELYKKLEELRGNTSKSEFLYLILLDYLTGGQDLAKELQKIRSRCLKKCLEYKQLQGELGKIGSNVNQIARTLNKKRIPSKEKEAVIGLAVETLSLVQDLKQKLAEEKGGLTEKDSQ